MVGLELYAHACSLLVILAVARRDSRLYDTLKNKGEDTSYLLISILEKSASSGPLAIVASFVIFSILVNISLPSFHASSLVNSFDATAGPPLSSAMEGGFAVSEASETQESMVATRSLEGIGFTPRVEMLHFSAIVAYSTLLVTSMSNWFLFSSGSMMRASMYELVIEFMMVLTYLQLYLAFGSGRILLPTFYGHHFPFTRVNLWVHSSLAQVLIYAVSPRVAATVGWTEILMNLINVLIMFILGATGLMAPPPFLHADLRHVWTVGFLAPASYFLLINLRFVSKLLSISLSVPGDAHPPLHVHSFMRFLRYGIIASWLSFPTVTLLTVLGLLSPEQDTLVITVCDIVAKGFTSVLLHSGCFASTEMEEKIARENELRERDITVKALKVFTQSIGHDLRTPLQALILCNDRAKRALRQHCSHSHDESHSANFAQNTARHNSFKRNSNHASYNNSPVLNSTQSAMDDSASHNFSLRSANGRASESHSLSTQANEHAPRPRAPGPPSSVCSPGSSTASFSRAASFDCLTYNQDVPIPLSARKLPVRGRGMKRSSKQEDVDFAFARLREIEASAELLTCIMGNLWDFESVAVDSDKRSDKPGADSADAQAGANLNANGIDINVNAMVERLVATLELSPVRRKGVTLQALVDPLVPTSLWGDKSRLARALLNLLVNAMKFTTAGHVSIRTTCVSRMSADTVSVRFDVMDTGCGMSDREREECILPYVHCHERRGGGLGLGLTIVSKAVAAMGSKLSVNSIVGSGTHFSFDLLLKTHGPSDPLDQAASHQSTATTSLVKGRRRCSALSQKSHSLMTERTSALPSSDSEGTSADLMHEQRAEDERNHIITHPPHSLQRQLNSLSRLRGSDSGKNVMLVDDVELIREGASEVLSLMGHTVLHSADDGDTALEILKQSCDNIDVVFMDIQLLSVDGDITTFNYREWEREYRKHKPPLAIYACTGSVTTSDVRRYASCGFNGVVSKPVTPDAYAAILSGDPHKIAAVTIPMNSR